MLGAAAAGAAVPGLNLEVEQPTYTQPMFVDQPARQHQLFLPCWSLVEGDGVLSCSLLVPPTAQGKGEVQLFWTGEHNAEIGWWSDYLELERESLSAWLAFPETVVKLKDADPAIVNKDILGQVEMRPEQLLMIAMYVPYPWGIESPLAIHGLQIDYEAV